MTKDGLRLSASAQFEAFATQFDGGVIAKPVDAGKLIEAIAAAMERGAAT